MVNHPIQDLRDRLEAARLEAIEALAAQGASMSQDSLQKVALLNAALNAVRDEISLHDVRLGGGSARPLA